MISHKRSATSVLAFLLIFYGLTACAVGPFNGTDSIQSSPEPTSAAQITPISTSSSNFPLTPEPQPTAVTESFFLSRYLLMFDVSGGYVVDIQDRIYHTFRSSVLPLRVLEIGCRIVALDGYVIQVVDIDGNAIEEIGVLSPDSSMDFLPASVTLSQNLTTYSYILGSGYSDIDRYEFQDLYVGDITSELAASLVSQNQNVSAYDWSSTYETLAFNDDDSSGGRQIFLYSNTSRRSTQLTFFESHLRSLRIIRWSLDDSKIATVGNSAGISNLWIVDAESGDTEFFDSVSHVNNIWWISEDKVLTYSKDSPDRKADGVRIVDLSTGQTEDLLAGTEFESQAFHSPIFIQENGILAFFHNSVFAVLDINSGDSQVFERIVSPILNGRWFVIPVELQDITMCGN
ncbi:MAG: hypothetical protein EPO32_02750 [Anaerolineae bacterium]|nr:MAG: hypothetical protein EPO32_02750 [Anaerolineae bacterium]